MAYKYSSDKFTSAAERYRAYQLGQAIGRRPSFTAGGELRGFRSTPGAAPSSRNMGGLPREETTDPESGLTDASIWAKRFPKSPTAQRMLPTVPAPAAPGSMTTAPTEMPPPGAWANPSSWLAPTTPSNVADMATVSPRAFSQPPAADDLHSSAIARNQEALKRLNPGFNFDPTYKNDSMGPGSRFVSGKYGWASSQPAAAAAIERKRNVEKYRNNLDVDLGGYLA